MALIMCTGAPGAPGITTTALGLALTWPRDVLLADCDREPTQAILAGYLHGVQQPGGGLMTLLRRYRENRPLEAELLSCTIPLTEGDPTERRFLPGFALPTAIRLFDAVWPSLADALAHLDGQGMDVIVDAGHLDAQGLQLPLLARADAVCIISRTSLRSLAATRLYLPGLTQQLRSLPVDKPSGLLLLGPGKPYRAPEITKQLAVDCWAEIDWDPAVASALSDGSPGPKKLFQRDLISQYRATGLRIRDRIKKTSPPPSGFKGEVLSA